MKILVIGSAGFLGSNLIKYFRSKNYDVCGSSRRDINTDFDNYVGDIREKKFTDELISVHLPDVIINTVSLANVDECERDPDYAYEIVVDTARNVSESAEKSGSRLIYISTDHLYDGKKSFYSEKDDLSPINGYGRLKKTAEEVTEYCCPESIIVRTNFFGWSPPGHIVTFGEWVYFNLKNNNEMKLFTDYYYTPIETTYLAEIIEKIINTDFSGIINVAGSDRCSKYDFGMKMAEIGKFSSFCIQSSTLSESGLISRRPGDLSLSTDKLRDVLNIEPPSLDKSIKKFLNDSYNSNDS